MPHLFALILVLTAHGKTETYVLDQHLHTGECMIAARKLNHAHPMKPTVIYYCNREF